MIKFHSIAQYRNSIKYARYLHEEHSTPSILDFEGTVKLHGSNASISLSPDNEITFQSRNNIITPGNDNYFFAGTMIDHEKEIRWLFDQIPAVYKSEHITIYGEWCGEGINKGKTAIANIGKKIFVIFAIAVGIEDTKRYVDMNFYKHLHNHDVNIYNILEFQTFKIKIDLAFPELAQEKLIEFTNEVERECPVAKVFGVKNIGEGIVYKCVTPDMASSDLWFKVKGMAHSVSKVKVLAAVDIEKIKSLKEFVEYAVTDNRLEQGLEYLKEQHMELSQKSTGNFIRWIYNDVIKEEADTMEQAGITQKEIGKYISSKARPWFFEKLDEDAYKKA